MWKLIRPDAIAVLKDEKACKSLARYFSVIKNENPAKFMIAKKIPAQFSTRDSAEELRQKHTELTQEFYETQREIDTKKRFLQASTASFFLFKRESVRHKYANPQMKGGCISRYFESLLRALLY